MTRILDPQPYYKSIEEFIAEAKAESEKPHIARSGVKAIGAFDKEWFKGYTAGVIEALARKDLARFNQEVAEAKRSAGTSRPHVTVKL